MARPDWELSARELLRRIQSWKGPNTLLNRLAEFGIHPYKASTLKRLAQGTFEIKPSRMLALQKRLVRLNMLKAKEIKKAAEAAKHVLPAMPVITSRWYTIMEWLDKRKEDDPTLNVEFSAIRLIDRGYKFVYQSGDKLLFTTKQQRGSPPRDMKPEPQDIFYSIEVEDHDSIETWIQVSGGLFYGSDPLSNKARDNAGHEVEQFQERNERAGAQANDSPHSYTWWPKGAKNSRYEFLGIGVNA